MSDHECFKNADVRYVRQNSVFTTHGAICCVCGKKWHTRHPRNYDSVNAKAREIVRKAYRK